MRLRTKATLVPIVLALVMASACAGNRSPATVAHYGAVNGTILVDAVDKAQDFIIAEEKAGNIPTDQARQSMVYIGKALESAKKAPPLLISLANLPVGSEQSAPIVKQVQDVLLALSTDAGQALIPIKDDGVRKRFAEVLVGVAKAINIVYGWLAKGGVA